MRLKKRRVCDKIIFMKRVIPLIGFLVIGAATSGFLFFQGSTQKSEEKASNTIVAEEIESYLLSPGESKRFEGQYQVTYFVDGDTVVRERITDYQTKEVKADGTVYQIQRQLISDPTNPRPWTAETVIRAIGQPGNDEVETLSISKDSVITARSNRDYILVSRSRRLK